MGERLVLYHGSAEKSFVPTFGLGKDQHDYGRGFYLTESVELAREWAVAASPFTDGWVHAYELDLSGLNVLDFSTLGPLPWMAELMKHRDGDSGRYYRENAPKFIARYGVDISGYDIVRGWRADASYFYICKSFVRNNIGIDFLSDLLSLGNFGIQYFVQSQRAFSALHELDDALEKVAASEYYDKYNRRDAAARTQMYELIEDDPRNRLDRTFKDII